MRHAWNSAEQGKGELNSHKSIYTVGAIHTGTAYSPEPPFDPDEAYPETPRQAIRKGQPNPAYEGLRKLFSVMGYDYQDFGTAHWNPLGWLVKPGDTVVLKPNLIKEMHPRDLQGWSCMLTHGSFIRAVADYIYIALRGKGGIVVCDAPQTDSSFDQIC